MMAGEELSECEVCDHKLLNTNVYRSYFNQLFKHKVDEAYDSTDETGATTMPTVSFDYRFNNLCNFKCRMCGDMLSSVGKQNPGNTTDGIKNHNHGWRHHYENRSKNSKTHRWSKSYGCCEKKE